MEKRRLLLKLSSCPYCKNAEEALKAAGVEYQPIEVDPYDRSIVQLLSGQPSVPILVEVIGAKDQDDDIIAYIKELKS